MPRGFSTIRYHVADDEGEMLSTVLPGAVHRGGRLIQHPNDAAPTFTSDEAAARFYLQKFFEQDKRPNVRGLAARDHSEPVPDLKAIGQQTLGLTNTRIVSFSQTTSSIPIFGSRLTVELDKNRNLKDIGGAAAENLESLKRLSPKPALSPAEASARIARLTGDEKALAGIAPPQLMFFLDEDHNSWHLTWFFKEVPAAPPAFADAAAKRTSHGHGLGRSPRLHHPRLNFLVDAHFGDILLYYSATPLMAIPSKCKGTDELDRKLEFWGAKTVDGGFELFDPMRRIKTYDYGFKDVSKDPAPASPVRSQGNDFANANKAAVSAHVNAAIVDDFLRTVLMRDGIDDNRMTLESIVNCTDERDQPPPEWQNAFWWGERMWYGQDSGDGKTFKSYSRFLDVIAHELMHGVTETTADLMYYKQSGALNESLSDIFAVIISNWNQFGEGTDVNDWNWQIGAGLGKNGQPLRNLGDPSKTDDPDHMKNYLDTLDDSGGVHTNSNIHNKAAYNLLTATRVNGDPAFSSREVAVLYYLSLVRLGSTANFKDIRDTLLEVARVYFSGETDLDDKLDHIRIAYHKVGIE